MRFCAIICELNPLHNGHKYLLEQARKLTNLPIICIMSGNFTQRGDIAVLDKYTRANHAILTGADVVLELPTIYSINSAEYFATGAINILNSLDCVDYLIFGSECGDIVKLQNVVDIFIKQSKNIDFYIKQSLKQGISYPKAQQLALDKIVIQSKDFNENITDIISTPNNILAIEYLKALKKINSKIKPITVKRIGEDYKSKNINYLSSASAIRDQVFNHNTQNIKNSVPEYVFKDLQNYTQNTFIENYLLLKIKLSNIKYLQTINEVTEGLEYRLKKYENSNNLIEFIENIKTKRYTTSKLKRILLNNAFGITKQLAKKCKITKPYCKILKISNNNLLKYINQNKNINLLYSDRDVKKLDKLQSLLYNIDKTADYIFYTT